MKITKLEHSGMIFEKNGKKIVCDPVEFKAELPEMTNVVAVIITHKHGDHLQLEKLEGILANNPEAKVFMTQDNEVEIEPGRLEKLPDGAIWQLGDFELRFFGENHAAIVPGTVPCENLGVVIDERIVNPGDSFDIPEMENALEVLLVPSAAPWCKVTEGMEYIKAMKPKVVIPVHNAVLSELGNGFNNNWLKMACDEVGAELKALGVGETIEV